MLPTRSYRWVMALIRLHNDDWGYESNCFVCEQRNAAGLRVPFFHDTERGVVTAPIELGSAHSGAPTLLHGGIVLALLDEAMAWACIAVARRWAVTTETHARFERAVRVDTAYDVTAEILSVDETEIHAAARVDDSRGRLRTSAAATFTILGEAQMTRLAGRENESLAETARLS